MQKLGLLTPIDKNGRIVIPKELRRQLGLKNNVDRFEIYADGDSIILKKSIPCCVFCGEKGDVLKFGDHMVCLECIDKLTAQKNVLEEL